ncbi:hypothetical protein M3Y99_00659100 [Aphelenchoides fujianensis]|nr:hypothetical protein M3Y99_00659100 [Aphelenchoides fujianensis]
MHGFLRLNDKVITLIDGADDEDNCPGKKLSRYNPEASKTFEGLPARSENEEVDHREKFASRLEETKRSQLESGRGFRC